MSTTSIPGEREVDAPVYCTLSRFGLRRWDQLLRSYADYRSVLGAANSREVGGLLRTAFLVENPTTWYSLSIWSERPFFSAAVPEHILAARRVFGRLAFEPGRGPELWSTRWRLVGVSNNLNWDDFDLAGVLADAEGERVAS